jgi:hypothetical protein
LFNKGKTMEKVNLETKLVEILGAIADGVAQAKDFAVEQLPDIAQQYILLGRAWETITFSISIAAVVGLIYVTVKIPKSRIIENDAKWALEILTAGAAFFALLIAIHKLKDFLLVWFAPKLYLIQGLAQLVK